MVDSLSAQQRSERMSLIKGRDTMPEMALRRALHSLGFRYRLGGAGLPGKPDLVLPKYKSIIFVHGCFWHRHKNCRIASTPKSNVEFWQDKFDKNVSRDKRVGRALRALRWRVYVVWECDLNSASKALAIAKKLAVKLKPV